MIAARLVHVAYLISWIFVCWFGFMAVHELGHIIAAALSGGEISRVVLHPFTISQTDLSTNPNPLLVVWLGPLTGCALPMMAVGVSALTFKKDPFDLQPHLLFFAGFCLIANGAYIGFGSFDGTGDCSQMLQHGTPIWVLWIFGALAMAIGFLMWHRLGSIQKFLASPRVVDRRLARFVIFCALLLLGLGFVL